jgi:LCP family protein required for cell wall assembly
MDADEPRIDGPDEPGTEASGADDPPEGPPPATWAGRLGAEASEPEPDEEGPDTPQEPPGGELEDGSPAQPAAASDDAVGDATVEADTPELADREAAREAALEGLRARTAEHAAKRQTGATAATSPAATPAPAATAPPAVDRGKTPEPEGEQTPPPGGASPPPEPQGEAEPPRGGLFPRFVAGSLLIIVAMATATAVSLLVYLTDLARGLGGLPSVRSQLEVADPGKPQTILILGSDKRSNGQEFGRRSDTTILLRVASAQITVLSIPRDLKVNIPGHGIDKFNAAYSYGGPKLTLRVVKQLTGLDNINHVVNVDFTGFADAVNAIDCVYVDVDHHYYHSNLGLAPSEQYAEIDIPAGYQRMCGLNALQYVRYRHDDNDLVRSARQQEFLREARQELPPAKLISDRSTLTEILKEYVTSDIEDPPTLISLGKLFLAARRAPVVQVHFPAKLGASYVTASQEAVRNAVAKFEGEAPSRTASPQAVSPSGGGSGVSHGSKKQRAPKPPPAPLVDSTALGRQYAAKLAGAKRKSGKPMLDFPVYYPTKLAPGSTITDDSRAFPIDGPGSDVYHGYRIVAELPTAGYTAYYGVSGTDWEDPPILENPDETKTIDGRGYLESWDGDHLRLVGWKTRRGSYWVDNTLLTVLTPGQMLGIAEAMRRYTG